VIGKHIDESAGITLVGGWLNIPAGAVIPDDIRFGKTELDAMTEKEETV
jgi:hypothetical protein